jgi:hypothetical protein
MQVENAGIFPAFSYRLPAFPRHAILAPRMPAQRIRHRAPRSSIGRGRTCPLLACLLLALALALPAGHAHAAAANPPPDPTLLRRLATTLVDQGSVGDRFDAEVWLHWVTPKLARHMRDPRERSLLIAAVHREAARHRIDPDLVLAVIDVESRFDRFAVSRAGAQGVMQVMPFWKQEIGRPDDNLLQVDTNIRYGTAILAHYIERSRGDIVQALARYNGSHGLLNYPQRVMAAWRSRWRSKTSDEVPDIVTSCNRNGLAACSR